MAFATWVGLIISICAIILTLQQTLQTRHHNKLSVRPKLTTSTETTYPAINQIERVVTLSNNGLGPAIIKSFELLIDGIAHPVDTPQDMFILIQDHVMSALTPQSYFHVLRKESVMAKEQTIILTKLIATVDGPAQIEEFKKFQLKVCYESAYGEDFIYDTRDHLAEA